MHIAQDRIAFEKNQTGGYNEKGICGIGSSDFRGSGRNGICFWTGRRFYDGQGRLW